MDQSEIFGRVELNPSAPAGTALRLVTSKQGVLTVEALPLRWALEGRVFHTQQGDAATQLDFAETAYDEDQPQGALRVPTGVVAIPISLVLTNQDQAGTDTHFVISRTSNDIGNGTSTAATATNMRTDAPRVAQCVPRSLYTGNATAATGLIEIARFVDPFAAEADRLPRYAVQFLKSSVIPILVGPATLQWHIFATTTQPQGFTELFWAEFDKADMVST